GGRRRARPPIRRAPRRRSAARRWGARCGLSCPRRYARPSHTGRFLAEIGRTGEDGRMRSVSDVEELARSRLRSLRTTPGYSLHELAERPTLRPSPIRRIETGRRTLGLDVLVPLANPL